MMWSASFSSKDVPCQAYSSVFLDFSEVMVPFRTPKSLFDSSVYNIIVFFILTPKLNSIVGLHFAEFFHLVLKK
jgi:hypothetical protein